MSEPLEKLMRAAMERVHRTLQDRPQTDAERRLSEKIIRDFFELPKTDERTAESAAID